MSTCTDLINAINAVVVDPNLIASVDPSTIAVLQTGNTTDGVFVSIPPVNSRFGG